MKWAVREAVDVYFKAKTVFKLGAKTFRAGEPILIFDTVKTSTLDETSEMSYVTGGRGNARLLSFEGDKALTFQFEEALLSMESLAILAGADLIPARNKNLSGAAPEAKPVIAHKVETYAVTTANIKDEDDQNVFPDDASISRSANSTAIVHPRGGELNVWLSEKPYVGQNADIYVMLLDDAGEISGIPIQINLKDTSSSNTHAYISKWATNDKFIAIGKNGRPLKKEEYPDPSANNYGASNDIRKANAVFDDQVLHYIDLESAKKYWVDSWGDVSQVASEYQRTIAASSYGTSWGGAIGYSYLLAPPGGNAQPKGYKEGEEFVYKVNVPSILYQDIVKIDYYVEYKHDATQVSILPDKFAPFVYVEGSSLVRRASDGMDLPLEFVIPKLKLTTAINFTLQGTGDASTFTFQGDAYPDFSKFDLTRKVLANIQILDADDNYDLVETENGDPTSYRRFRYNEDNLDNSWENGYLWKDSSIEQHQNLDYSDVVYKASDGKISYDSLNGGPATKTEGAIGKIQ